MKRNSFTNSGVKVRSEYPDMIKRSTNIFEIVGIKKPITVSDSDMVGQPVFYGKKLVGTIMDQWDGHSLVIVDPQSVFVIEDYKSGQIKAADIKIHLRG